jgi:hypothetical protein
MPACYNTLHDIDTAEQPRGCGGQQGWNVRGKPPERVGGAVRVTVDCAAAPTCAAAAAGVRRMNDGGYIPYTPPAHNK